MRGGERVRGPAPCASSPLRRLRSGRWRGRAGAPRSSLPGGRRHRGEGRPHRPPAPGAPGGTALGWWPAVLGVLGAPSPPGRAARGVPWCPRAGVPRLPRAPSVAARGLRPLPLAAAAAPRSRPLDPLWSACASLPPLAVPHRSQPRPLEAGGAALTPTPPRCRSPVPCWAGGESACVQMVSVKRRRFLLSPPLSPVTSSVISV